MLEGWIMAVGVVEREAAMNAGRRNVVKKEAGQAFRKGKNNPECRGHSNRMPAK
jgi:hypothetical protein